MFTFLPRTFRKEPEVSAPLQVINLFGLCPTQTHSRQKEEHLFSRLSSYCSGLYVYTSLVAYPWVRCSLVNSPSFSSLLSTDINPGGFEPVAFILYILCLEKTAWVSSIAPRLVAAKFPLQPNLSSKSHSSIISCLLSIWSVLSCPSATSTEV